ncbi:MAG: nuclear transport factor 2 family protein, partial [Actinomycetota bacterium]|nr:nuclear transport factor 2 family protein [Actinomycetota bacterium]
EAAHEGKGYAPAPGSRACENRRVNARDPAEQIATLQRLWAEAVRSRDIEALDELLGAEFTLTTGRPAAPVRSRRDYLDITRDRYFVESFEYEEMEVLVYETAALVRSRYRQRGSMDGEPRDAVYLMTDVWVARDGRWQAVTRHVSPIDS